MAHYYCPDRGDIVWMDFDPQSGREQAGHRPALVLSPEAYNRKVGLAIFCPITSQVKGYPFEVAFPEGHKATGVVLADQVKSLDWKARQVRLFCAAPVEVMENVCAKLSPLLGF
ncbi:MAG: mRNA-degrading endonuclease [Candidatus Raymondbacteria bacterium RifOxyA12_full_50_37]|uniref:mRNA-degrading endonuclease n=1 Tax=Candidatus Raymondbacteria bacterium RIFOXYD12_FULL_49_13 TaxID=1817890 RepID=A0A1F7FFI0_UNCRA|nr:MAG: mRNA-degrading endonuclease [Candidatus Raymondbacteria bacterium RifOxyA12_full_50_37]OGJ94239.1 MAG: mRNA-degrading endonuclease [Candidatus Raymondbacteria bacterium RIFOXYA2_FULL_49_16]OGJ98141.1 MAG: mRNA-degrading endonuclease [Candidatus Raymondbacteria bacterium RifOxyB12_full_50_8]OGJ99069.1 MAG: mRNA-degrading endonuclease [Candidatus Raymondbacteria bacterium RIFOXYC2_FULL_50_21]OGK05454.1 MAG: mRNA-degrading endonuclease [Candidatus Raymondbacteria bacterium RIFOXYD12_FULL_4